MSPEELEATSPLHVEARPRASVEARPRAVSDEEAPRPPTPPTPARPSSPAAADDADDSAPAADDAAREFSSASDDRECPICFEAWNVNESKCFRTCCCKRICKKCDRRLGRICPLCREKRPANDAEVLARLRREGEGPRPWT